MQLDLDLRKSARHRDRRILARVIDEDDAVDNPVGHDFVVGLAQGPGGVIRRHDDDNFLAR